MIFNINERTEYQKFIIDYLVENNGYIQRSNKDFNQGYAIDVDCLFEFLYNTQKDNQL